MASSEKVHYSIFPIVGTVNERGLILYVRENYFTASTTLTQGTTLANFMSSENVPKGDAITQGFGSFIYREQLTKEGNNLRFVFLQNKTTTEQLQPVRPLARINQVTDWPDWLLSLYMLDAIIELQDETGSLTISGLAGPTSTAVTGRRFLDRYILIRGGQFNTVHEVEEFFSPNPIPSLTAEEPRPDRIFYNYFGVNNTLDCIHSLVTIPEPYISAERIEDFGTENAREVDWSQGSIFPPTNHTTWKPHYRILNVSERDGGYYYRRHRVLPPRISRPIQI